MTWLGSYGSILGGNPSRGFPSAYSPRNATVSAKTLRADVVQHNDSSFFRVDQTLQVGYPEIPWKTVRASAGWASLQWQMVAYADLTVAPHDEPTLQHGGLVMAISMDKVSEFAIVPAQDFEQDHLTSVPCWHNGDWYSYIKTASNTGDTTNGRRLPDSHHLIQFVPGEYKVLVRSMYEIRIFADPREADPQIKLGITFSGTPALSRPKRPLVELSAISTHTNVPNIVGGWMAGWGVSFGVRNYEGQAWFLVHDIELVGEAKTVFDALLPKPIRLAPGQSRQVPVKLTQLRPLNKSIDSIRLRVSISPVNLDKLSPDPDNRSIASMEISLKLQQRPAFYNEPSPNVMDRAFTFSYLARDSTLQVAAAIPPQIATSESLSSQNLAPPLILALHGAGVDVRNHGFASNFHRQNESWIIQPTGRTPW
ncbi:hypothetical protein ACQY0O_002600 [Thecaphora frezii]